MQVCRRVRRSTEIRARKSNLSSRRSGLADSIALLMGSRNEGFDPVCGRPLPGNRYRLGKRHPRHLPYPPCPCSHSPSASVHVKTSGLSLARRRVTGSRPVRVAQAMSQSLLHVFAQMFRPARHQPTLSHVRCVGLPIKELDPFLVHRLGGNSCSCPPTNCASVASCRGANVGD